MSIPLFKPVQADYLKTLPPTEIISGTRFVARGLNVIFGASGAFKSFYTLDAALRISQTSPVLYIAAEGAGGLYRRIAAWQEYYKQPAGQLHFICREVNLLTSEQVQGLLAAVKPLKPILVIFDTLARCISGGDENSAKDMGIAVRNSSLIQRELDTGLVWVHHTNRADRGERGSGAIRGAADSMIEVAATGDGVIRVSCSKSKDGEPWPTEDLTFHPIANSGVLLPATDFNTIAINLTPTEKSILEFLSLSVFESAGTQILQVCNALNVSERHVYRLLSGLKNKGLTENVGKGTPMRLTDIGREILSTFTDKRLPKLEVLGKIEVE